MPQKRTNKYPNNRFTSKSVMRTKKISPHTVKNKSDKANRNGSVKKTIPAYHLTAPKLSEKEENGFFSNIFKKDGYYNYLWIPFVLLVLTVVLDFSLQLAVYGNFNPYYASLAKNTMFFLFFSMSLLCVNIGSFVYMGLQTAKHNVNFSKTLKVTLKIILVILVLEILFTTISYFTFLSPYIQLAFNSHSLRVQYLLYLLTWNTIKSVIYAFLISISYLLFFKLKFV